MSILRWFQRTTGNQTVSFEIRTDNGKAIRSHLWRSTPRDILSTNKTTERLALERLARADACWVDFEHHTSDVLYPEKPYWWREFNADGYRFYRGDKEVYTADNIKQARRFAYEVSPITGKLPGTGDRK